MSFSDNTTASLLGRFGGALEANFEGKINEEFKCIKIQLL
jgi:hypothetical protein